MSWSFNGSGNRSFFDFLYEYQYLNRDTSWTRYNRIICMVPIILEMIKRTRIQTHKCWSLSVCNISKLNSDASGVVTWPTFVFSSNFVLFQWYWDPGDWNHQSQQRTWKGSVLELIWIKTDLPENLLFDNERSDTVSSLSPYDEHLSKDRNALRLSFHDATGIWVITFTLV